VKIPLPPIAIRRFTQAHAQIAEATNRAAGQGAGFGFTVMQLVASAGNFDASYATSSTTDVVLPGVTTDPNSLFAGRGAYYLILLTTTGRVSGSAGTYGYGTIYIDGVAQTHTIGRLVALWDKGCGGFTSSTLFQVVEFQPGISHTVTFQLHVDNALLTFNHYATLLEVFLLGN
jgi:hypothetical protein